MDATPLLTDVVALHGMQASRAQGLTGTAVFDVVVRSLPPGRNFLVAAGLEPVIEHVAGLRFSAAELDWLEQGGGFTRAFVDYLGDLRFTGDVDALPEGTVFFADEPILRLAAPLVEILLVESRIVNLLQFSILAASQAVRCVLAAQGRDVFDFGLRWAHGAEAALLAARSGFIAGYDGTATALAGQRYGIPVAGALAHACVEGHGGPEEAFAAFARTCPGPSTLLLDVEADGEGGVGEVGRRARLARAALDAAGWPDVRIAAAGDLDEHAIAALVAEHAPIDMFGVGARASTSADAPWLDCACVVAEYGGRPRRGHGPGHATWPGRKQLFRCLDDAGLICHDTLGGEAEGQQGRPLLVPILQGGRRVSPCWSLAHVRQTLRTELASLSPALLGLAPAPPPPLLVSPGLRQMAEHADRGLNTPRAR